MLPILCFVEIFNEDLGVLGFVISVENVSSDLGFSMVILFVTEVNSDLSGKSLFLLNLLELFLQGVNVEIGISFTLFEILCLSLLILFSLNHIVVLIKVEMDPTFELLGGRSVF